MGTRPERVKPVGKPKPGRPARRGKVVPRLEKLQREYGLSRRTVARALGVPEADLGAWEERGGHPGTDERAKVRKLEAILKRAAGAMRMSYLPTWLTTPSNACAELGAATPLELLGRGDYAAVEDLLYSLGSGVPF
jgi:hypothetical protein